MAGQTKIRHPHPVVFIDEDVLGLEVTMHDAHSVSSLESFTGIATFAEFQAALTGFVYAETDYTVLSYNAGADRYQIEGIAPGEWTAAMVEFIV